VRAAPPAGATLLDVLVRERGHVRADEVEALTGERPDGRATPGGYLVGDEHARVLVARAEDDVRTYHRDAPDEPGIGREELRRRLGVPPSLFAAASSAPRSSRRRTSSGSRATARPRRAARMLADAGLTPPPAAELPASPRLLAALVRDGRIVMAGPFVRSRCSRRWMQQG
jgi:hypothetical protein